MAHTCPPPLRRTQRNPFMPRLLAPGVAGAWALCCVLGAHGPARAAADPASPPLPQPATENAWAPPDRAEPAVLLPLSSNPDADRGLSWSAPGFSPPTDDWSVSIEGVRAPRILTLRELKRLSQQSTPLVLQCAGAGQPDGHATGCVIWTGVPLRDVVLALGGVAEGMRFITSAGTNSDPHSLNFTGLIEEHSLPLQALDEAVLAWELNGEPMATLNGGPVRLVFPGPSGAPQVKYIKRVAFTPHRALAQASD